MFKILFVPCLSYYFFLAQMRMKIILQFHYIKILLYYYPTTVDNKFEIFCHLLAQSGNDTHKIGTQKWSVYFYETLNDWIQKA